jgi:DUF1009 family protein
MLAAEESRLISATGEGITRLGIIAGGGSLPERLVRVCDEKNIEIFLIGFEGQTDPALLQGRNHMVTRIGCSGKIINTLKAHHFRDLVWIGALRRPSLKELRPDLRTARFFARVGLRALGDDGLLKAARDEFEKEGFVLHGIQEFAADLVVDAGRVGTLEPKDTDWVDINRGLEVSQALGALDVGQSVVVQQGIVLGVEGAEGTDELIRRCAGYRRRPHELGGILVKTCKPGQDIAFDLPTIGPRTVRNCAEAGLHGIVFHAGKTLLPDAQEVAELADKYKIFVIGLDPARKHGV